MSKRTCLIIEDDVDKKLRTIQARLIKKNNRSFSYSAVINYVLGKNFVD